jgi:hypothetical protein
MSNSHNPEYINASGSYVGALLQDLVRDEPLQGIAYANILLSGPDVVDEYDPDILVVQDKAVVYFPGGDPENGSRIESVVFLPDENKRVDVQRLREQTLSLYVGKAALARIDPTLTQMREVFNSTAESLGNTGIGTMIEVCEQLKLPLGIVEYREIQWSAKAAVGEQIVLFSHPIFVHPKPALRHLQKGIKTMIANEQL